MKQLAVRARWSAAIALVALLMVCHGVNAQFFGFNAQKKSGDDLYATLGVPKRATQKEIKKAFRERARDSHPDLKDTPDEKAAAKEDTAKILRAYNILSDEVKRDTYDRFGVIAGENGVPADANSGGGGGAPFGFDPFYRQQRAEPIKSKTSTISSVAELRELMAQTRREPTILVVQAYHDACFECRLVSGPWENLANSGWAYGAAKLARVSMDQGEESQAILLEAGVSYGPAPVIFAVMDGIVMSLSSLPGVLFKERHAMIQPMIFDFVASFFVDTSLATTPVSQGLPQLEHAIRAACDNNGPPSAAHAAVLISHNVDQGLAHSIQARHMHAKVIVVDFTTLHHLLKSVCRLGNIDPSVTELVGLLPLLPIAAFVKQSGFAAGGALCPHLRAATSSSHFSATRAIGFVSRHFQVNVRSASVERAGGGDGERVLELLDASTMARDCRTYCVVLLMASCSAVRDMPSKLESFHDLGGLLKTYVNRPNEASTFIPTSDLLEDLSPFQPMFVCLDLEPALAAMVLHLAKRSLPSVANLITSINSLDSALLILSRRTGSASKAILLPRTAKSSSSRFTKLQSLLADVVEDIDHATKPFTLGTTLPRGGGGDAAVVDDIQRSLVQRTLSVKWWRLVLWKFYAVVDAASGLFALLPLALIWYGMKWCSAPSAPRRPAPAAGAGAAAPNSHQPRAQQKSTASASSPPPQSNDGAPRISSMYHVPFFGPADIRNAEDGKGFMVLIFHRSTLAMPGPLPMSLMSDGRFTIRVVEEQHGKWWRWLDELMIASGRAKGSTSDPSPQFVAVRKGKMLAALKPSHTTVAIWCSELLDGSYVPSHPLPK